VFEVTLVNDGTIGHSIDFHAAMLAPVRADEDRRAGQVTDLPVHRHAQRHLDVSLQLDAYVGPHRQWDVRRGD